MTDFLVKAARTEPDGDNVRSLRSVPERQALVVVGMHRSGTSAFARLLGLLGAALPADMGESAEDNEAGFWEPLPIRDFDDELLAVAGSRWDDVIALPTEWFESEAAGSQIARALALLEQEYADAPLFVLKDPRICRLLPFWQRVFAAAGVEARYVLPLRNPLEVAASLKQRNGFPTEKSLLLWLEHVLSAERWTRGQPRGFARYEDLLEDPYGVIARLGGSLGLAWPRLNARTRLEIDRFLVRDLRHHTYPDNELGLRGGVAGWVTHTYRALLGLAAGTGDQDARYEALDQVSAELREADAAYGSLLAALEIDLDAAQDERRTAEQEVDARDAALQEIAAEQSRFDGQLAELREQLATAASERERLAGELGERLEARGHEAEALEVEHQGRQGRFQNELTELREQLASAATEREQLAGELEARLPALEHLRDQLDAAATERERMSQELEARLAKHSADLEQLERIRSELAATGAALDTKEAERARLQTELESLQAALTSKDADLASATDESTRLRDRLNEALAARAIYTDELKRALDRLDEQHKAAAAEQATAVEERIRLEGELTAATQQAGRLRDEAAEAVAGRAAQAQEFDAARIALVEQRRAVAGLQSVVQRQQSEVVAGVEQARRLRAQLAEAEVSHTATSHELELAIERLEEHDQVASAEKALAGQERSRLEGDLEASHRETTVLYGDLARERKSARTQLAAAARERERLQGELEARVAEHSTTLLELGRTRSELVGAQTQLIRRSFHGRLRRLRRWPLVRLYLIWAAVVPAGVRLRIRYASQLGSWLARPTPTRLGWIRAYFSLRRSGAFDYHYYAHRYPEVVRRRMNPLMHYIEHGAREGRDPSARFSTAAYLARRPDLDPRRRNPLFEAHRRGEVAFAAADALATAAPLASTAGAVAVTVEPERPPGDDEAPARPGPPADWRQPSSTGVDVLCLPIIDWHYRFQRPQQLATQFAAAGHRVFYAETKFQSDGDAIRPDPLADGVWSVGLPGPREKVIYTSTLDEAELERLLSALDAFSRVASISHAVVVVDLPFWAPLALEAGRRFGWRVIYDCMDHHAGFLDDGFGSAAVRIAIEQNEEALLHESDAVLTTSRLLDERVRPIARKSVLLPNATDFEHFNKRPSELAIDESLERPVIGYYGAISSWFDVELVETAARARPHWSFVLVGSTFGADVTALETLPNVHLHGERPYAEIPAYLHAFDVACIPFKLNALTEATNPVKFYEYLSAGKPIVASALPELEPYEGYYYPARTAAEFLAQVDSALHEDVPPQASSKRIALALNNTWSARWKDLARLLRSWFGRVAIVVLSYDNPEYLRQCLESVWAKTRYPSYDVYVVENGSNPEIDAYLTAESETHERLHVIRPGANLGFARANNLAVELAGDCEYVVLLNDDVVVTDGWLTTLLRHLEDDTVGIVGPVTNWTGNEARVDVDYDGLEGMDDFAARCTAGRAGATFDITSLAMYCVAVRRRLFDSLGRLDERFEVGMFEDDDFALRVRDAGLRVVCAEDVFIHHWGRASFSRMDQEQYNAVFEANRCRFEEKWGRAWEPHRSR